MKRIITIVFCFLSITLFAGNSKTDKTKESNVKELMKNQPLEFIENKGQIINTEGKVADNVLFKASCGSFDIYITDRGLSYVFVKTEDRRPKTEDEASMKQIVKLLGKGSKEEIEEKNKIISYYRLDMNLEGASIDKANIIKEDESKQGHYNYFYPHCPEGIYDVKAFGKITIKNIYKGIDWVIYCNSNNKEQPIKYDFVVHPQADYKDIKIKFVNADSLGLTDNETKLKISSIAGNIEEGNLYSYQTNKKDEIPSKYVMGNDSLISFEIADYDTSKTLIIDPLVWATLYDSVFCNAYFESACVDGYDNIYITGYYENTQFPTQFLAGAYWQPNYSTSGYESLFIIKFSSQCIRLWATTYSGISNATMSNAICSDHLNNIYLTGFTQSNFPTQQLAGAYWQPTITGSGSAFILKFNSNGVRQWATYYGGSDGYDYGLSICADFQNNIYIVGHVYSTDFPTQQMTGAYWQPSFGGMYDVFILKFNSNGVRQWATYYGGNNSDAPTSVCVDNQNNVYITGFTSSYDFPKLQLSGAYWQSSHGGNFDAFILKFNSLGVRLWATYYGGSAMDIGQTVCADSHNNIFIAGTTQSINLPTQLLTGAYWQPTKAGSGNNVFILKFNNIGIRQWATYFGGSGGTTGGSNYYFTSNVINVDNNDSIYITGSVGQNFPVQQLAGEYWQPSIINGTNGAFLSMFNSHGVLKWSTYYGGSHYTTGCRGVVLDHQNSAYFYGICINDSIYTVNPGNGAYYISCNSISHTSGFILKVSMCFVTKPNSLISNRNNICTNDTGTITLTAIGGLNGTVKWYSGGCGINYIGYDSIITIPSPTQTTTYYARRESECDTSECDSIIIQVLPIFSINQNKKICYGEIYHIGTHYYSTSGVYIDTLATNMGCDSIVTTNLTVVTVPPLNLGNDTTLCKKQTLLLHATNQFQTYLWQDNTNDSIYKVTQKGLYWVKVSIDSNCYTGDTILVNYINCDYQDIFIPNSFTPNGDGLNEVFKIETLLEFSEFKLYIYNRWGEQIFESSDKNNGWDGKFMDKAVPVDVYVYLLKATVKDADNHIIKSGRVTVVR